MLVGSVAQFPACISFSMTSKTNSLNVAEQPASRDQWLYINICHTYQKFLTLKQSLKIPDSRTASSLLISDSQTNLSYAKDDVLISKSTSLWPYDLFQNLHFFGSCNTIFCLLFLFSSAPLGELMYSMICLDCMQDNIFHFIGSSAMTCFSKTLTGCHANDKLENTNYITWAKLHYAVITWFWSGSGEPFKSLLWKVTSWKKSCFGQR